MSYDQPGPYGGRPQQPGPGQPQQPGPYGHQPQAPQGVPPQGHGGPQQGGPGGSSQPQHPGHHGGWAHHGQVPTPPPGGGGGKKVGLVAGAVVALAAMAGGVWYFTGSGGAKPKDDGPHRLTAPAAVLGGTYRSVTKKTDEPRPLNGSKAKYLAGTGISGDSQSVVNVYSTSAELHDVPKAEGLVFLGVYGEVEDPGKTLDAVLAEMKKRPDTTFIGDPQDMSPEGLDGAVMKCRQAESRTPSLPAHTRTGVRCVWADHSTVGVVTPSKPTGGYSMDEAARIAADLRKEVRVAGK
ncbi:hypothetical protein [Streptomyces candidus]|uniref:Uncharacterized protein n=1 Tax=Streptomyces candidus TaxID=67283 RepID=A0A7X0HJD2_9ACTN|nr:hypothetical protein [Streptomyces candidus]MBB6438756.1 hypothetical protein [Streptomyces candidus]GHH53110.1 hypothetical protein GCM10018773_54170 [Streptomyces candidus]